MNQQRWCDRPGISPVLHKLFADAGTVSKRFAPGPRGQTRHRGGRSSARPPRNSAGGSNRQTIQESREQVGSALRNSGFRGPLVRVVINLAPADRRKEGPAFDLPIALGLLVASGQLDRPKLDGEIKGRPSPASVGWRKVDHHPHQWTAKATVL